MDISSETLALAESYLDDMLVAEQANDYEAWQRHFEPGYDNVPSKELFHKDIAHMSKELGFYKSREYFGFIKLSNEDEYPNGLRFIWKDLFEKTELVISVGMHQKNAVWYVNHYIISV